MESRLRYSTPGPVPDVSRNNEKASSVNAQCFEKIGYSNHMTTLTKTSIETPARPLRMLVSLIQEDLKRGREAAERAGLPYYQAAGEKLIEAKSQLDHGEFIPWVIRNFGIKKQQASVYMSLAKHTQFQKSAATDFSSLSEFQRQTGLRNPQYNTYESRKPSWQGPVREVINRVDTETLNLRKEELKRSEERDAQRKLALQLIDIGYKVLAKTLHPDKGGSRDAMARLNAVRDRLKQCV